MVAQVPTTAPLTEIPSAALRRVPGLEDGRAPLSWRRFTCGTVNEVFRVDTPQGRFVLRLDGARWRRPGVDRAREHALHSAAAAAGLAPALVHAAPEEGLLIMEYLEGCPWNRDDYAKPENLARLGARLAQLHALAPPPLTPLDPLGTALAYAAAIPDSAEFDAAERALLETVLRRLQDAAAAMAASASPTGIIHGDLVHSNLLAGSRLWLVDWEYAQIADPVMDAACLLAYYPAARPHAAVLLAATGLEMGGIGQRLAAGMYVYEALTWLWHRARGERASPPVWGTGLASAPARRQTTAP
ncbi:MAG: phosphotransferase [Steroidobacterales bacterium]